MRRKSERSKKAVASPEKVEKPEKPKRGRTTRRRKASSSSDAESVEEETPQVPIAQAAVEPEPAAEVSTEPTPAVVELAGDDKVWQVKTAESSSGLGEIKKLKICLTRPPSTPERERSPRGRKKLNRTVSSSDTPNEGSEEKRKRRHRSRRAARDSKDEADSRIEEAEERKAVSAEPQSTVDNKEDDKSETLEIVQDSTDTKETQEHPESTTGDPEEPAKEVPNVSSQSEITQNKNSTVENENATPQADTTETNDYLEAPKKQREKRTKNSTDEVPRSKPEKDISQELNDPDLPKNSQEQVSNPEESEEVEVNEGTLKINEHEKLNTKEIVLIKMNDDINESNTPEKTDTPIPIEFERKELTHDTGPVESTVNENTESAQVMLEPSTKKPTIVHEGNHDSPKSPVTEVPTPQAEHDDVFESRKSIVTRQDSSDAEKESYRKHLVSNSNIQNHTEINNDDVAKSTEEISTENYVAAPIVVSRKRRWGTRVSKSSQARPVSISTDILKEIIPDVKPAELDEVIHEKRQRKKSENAEKHRVDRPVLPKIVIDNTEHVNSHQRERERERDRDRERDRERGKENTSEAPMIEHRKISIVKEDNYVGRPPSPPRQKTSSVLYITNLVRPFTLAQLKNLLQRTGKLVQEGFWIDRIKSKCFVTYENEEQAVETRHALHGVTWPVSNPKTLQVDFSSSEALERMRKAEEEGGGPVSMVPGTVEDWLREQDAKKERFGETDEPKPWDRRNVVREWDMGKGDKEKEKLKKDERPLEKRRQKTPERSPEPARKFKKKEEEAPAKMLDDLFRKTKAIPCIYWLPLSAETIAVKEEQRRQHMAEHERRMQELERSRTHRRH